MLLFSSFFAGILALVVVGFLTLSILKKSSGDEGMRKLSLLIQDGARTFLKREYKVVAWVVICIALLIAVAPFLNSSVEIGWETAVAFVTGALCSGLAGYIAMSIATRSNARTTAAAKEGLKQALQAHVPFLRLRRVPVIFSSLLGVPVVLL